MIEEAKETPEPLELGKPEMKNLLARSGASQEHLETFDEEFEEMKELIAESVNDVFDEDAAADDVEDMEDYNVFVHSNKDSKDSGAPLAFASFCDDYPNREWTIFHI